MRRQHGSTAIRVAVAARFPEMVRIHESTAEYADELEVCAMISRADAVLDQARLLQPDVLLLSDELGPNRPDTLARLGALTPATKLVMLVSGEAGGAGVIADGVVRFDAPPAELRAAIVAAMDRDSGRQAPPAHARADAPESGATVRPNAPSWLRAATVVEAGPAAAEAAPADAPPADRDPGHPERDRATSVLVFSGKGGVGKSIIAANLATALATRGAAVALIDLDLQYGDVGILLHLEAHPLTIDALAQRGDSVDGPALEEALARSGDGVRVLLGPSSPESSDLVSTAGLEAILARLVERYDYVVVDSPAQLDERVVRVMESADQVLLVSSFGIASVKDTKVTLRLLQSLGIERERVALVVNQTHPRISFPVDEIERALRFPILSNLPFESRMDESVDNGRPMVVSEPRSGFSKQLGVIVEHVVRARDPGGTTGARHAASWRLRFGR